MVSSMAFPWLSTALFLLHHVVATLAQSTSSSSSGDPLQWVDTLIGSTNGGEEINRCVVMR